MQEPISPAQQHRENLAGEMKAASRVTIIGMILDAVLGVIKVIGGALFNSQALLVDGIHSFTDVASDLVVLGVMKVSRQEPDDDHPYGHQRIETFGTLVLGSILIAVGAALAWETPTPDRGWRGYCAWLAGSGGSCSVCCGQGMDFPIHTPRRPEDPLGSDYRQRLAQPN
nr:cation diffusion facilitator family transporter [Marinobacter adhaerens]